MSHQKECSFENVSISAKTKIDIFIRLYLFSEIQMCWSFSVMSEQNRNDNFLN